MWCIILFLRWQKILPSWPSSERESVLQEMWDSFHQHIQLPKTWKTAAWQTGTNDMEKICKSFQIVHLWSAGMDIINEDCCKQWKPWEIMFSLRKDHQNQHPKCIKMFATLFYCYVTISQFITGTQTRKPDNSPEVLRLQQRGIKGDSPTVDGYRFSVTMFPINEKNKVTSVLVSTTHILVVIIFTINRNKNH